jgi:CheY-like chemotaxis protein
MRILVVDDQEDSRDLTEGALLSAGYTDIVTTASGWETLKLLDVGRASEAKAPASKPVHASVTMRATAICLSSW